MRRYVDDHLAQRNTHLTGASQRVMPDKHTRGFEIRIRNGDGLPIHHTPKRRLCVVCVGGDDAASSVHARIAFSKVGVKHVVVFVLVFVFFVT